MIPRNVSGTINRVAGAVLPAAFVMLLLPVAASAQTPGQVSNPAPSNGAVNVPTTIVLSWTAAADARRYDVRLGTTADPPLVFRNLTPTTYQPEAPLAPGTTYFWRIDARGRGNTMTPGPVWSFTTAAAAPPPAPSVPASPSPPNGATDVSSAAGVGWAASSNATAYDVAFGTSSAPPVVSSNQTATSYDPPGDLAEATTYFWRVTAKGPGGSTLGPLWSFTTAAAPPPPPPPSTTLDRLRLMTWNVRMGKNAANVMNVDAQVELMGDSGAHVIVLQEVTISVEGNLPQLYESKLEALTGDQWNAVWAPRPLPSTTGQEGTLILSRLPIAGSSTHQMDTAPFDPSWLDTKRSAARAAVIVNGVTVNIFGTHLALDANHRQMQLNSLQTWLSTFPEPRLLGGDLNFVPGEAAYADMAGTFDDAWPALAGADAGYTMDRRSASQAPGRIDQWWQEKTDTSARATEIWVLKTKRSDHHALIVDIDVK